MNSLTLKAPLLETSARSIMMICPDLTISTNRRELTLDEASQWNLQVDGKSFILRGPSRHIRAVITPNRTRGDGDVLDYVAALTKAYNDRHWESHEGRMHFVVTYLGLEVFKAVEDVNTLTPNQTSARICDLRKSYYGSRGITNDDPMLYWPA